MCVRSGLHLVLALILASNPVSAGERTRYSRNTTDDWGMGFSDCLRRHYDGCKEFAKLYNENAPEKRERFEFVLGLESPLRKVFKDKFLFHGQYRPSVEIFAARNESEAVQVCVIPVEETKQIEDVKLSVSDLVGPGGTIAAARTEIRVVGYMRPEPVTYPVIYAGEWPDPLFPQGEFRVDVPPLELRPFWVEVHVPEDAKRGEYRGTITVTTSNSHVLTIPVVLRVWGFSVPREVHIPVTTGLKAGVFTVSGEPREEEAALRRYVECFLEHRINVGPPCTVPIEADPGYRKLDRELEWAIRRGMTSFCVARNLRTDEGKKQFVDLCNHLREKGWLKYARVQVGMDEPDPEHYAEVVEDARAVKALVPDIRTIVTESPHPDLIGSVDIFGSDPCTERPEWNRRAKEAGACIQYSLCHIPVRAQFLAPQSEAPNMILDVPAVYHRVVFWLAWANEVDEIAFWGGNLEWPDGIARTWPEKPWPAKWPGDSVYSGVHNGNGVSVYPGRNGTPWPSIRMKVLRDGSEDYEYLWVLRDLIRKRPDPEKARLLNPVPAICVTPTYFAHQPDPILDRRIELGKAIEEMVDR